MGSVKKTWVVIEKIKNISKKSKIDIPKGTVLEEEDICGVWMIKYRDVYIGSDRIKKYIMEKT